jgi:flotillin
MLMVEHLDKLAETSAKAISNIKFDKVVVWENGKQDGQSSTANFLHGMTRSLPPMLQVLRDIAGVEIPETLVKLTPESLNGVSTRLASADDGESDKPTVPSNGR